MKLSCALLFAALFQIAVTPVGAAIYARAGPLFNQPSDLHIDNATAFRASLKNSTAFAGALGYKFTLFRIEAELVHLRSETEPDEISGTLVGGITRTIGSINETSGFANAYFDIPGVLGFSPYVGAGLGYARIETEGLGVSRNSIPTLQFPAAESVLGYQAMLGLQYTLLSRVTLNAGYRIVQRDAIGVNDVIANARRTLTLGNNRMFELGLAIRF